MLNKTHIDKYAIETKIVMCTKRGLNTRFKYVAGIQTCCRNSWTLETKQHHTGRLFPDLTARSFEADKITLKCKGDMTVSSEPDGSILSLARQDRSSGSAAMFFFF